jgi:hypothetical protein
MPIRELSRWSRRAPSRDTTRAAQRSPATISSLAATGVTVSGCSRAADLSSDVASMRAAGLHLVDTRHARHRGVVRTGPDVSIRTSLRIRTRAECHLRRDAARRSCLDGRVGPSGWLCRAGNHRAIRMGTVALRSNPEATLPSVDPRLGAVPTERQRAAGGAHVMRVGHVGAASKGVVASTRQERRSRPVAPRRPCRGGRVGTRRAAASSTPPRGTPIDSGP